MKKAILITISVIILICFNACSIEESKFDNTQKETTISTQNKIVKNKQTKSENNDKTNAGPYNDGFDIEKVILSYLGQKSESTYDEDAHIFPNKINNYKDISEVLMTDKVGEILVKYKNNNEYISFATLYIGSYQSLYSKYISDTGENYAYKVDEQTLDKG